MNLNMQPYKGARDFYPEVKRLQKWMFNKWRKVVERYGFEEYDASIIEPLELYLMKTSEEIINEQVYSFVDRGDRKVALRPEMTPTVSRMIAGRRQELAYPVRWYSIPNLWRYERPQRGRLREHWQLNVDIFGVSSLAAELEMIQVVDDIFQEFNAKRNDYTIKLNSRKLVDVLFKSEFKLNSKQSEQLVRLTDKKAKISTKDFSDEVMKIVNDKTNADNVVKILSIKDISVLPAELKNEKSYEEIQDLIADCKSLGITNVEFDVTLMRGFDYYTDIVFEVFDTDPENNRAMFGGGRYDGLIGEFGVEPVPTVGFGMGDVTFMNFLESHKLTPKLLPKTDVVILVRDEDSVIGARKVAQELRELGINVAVDYTLRKIDKQFKAAIKSDIRYAVFVGKDEITNEQYVLKDLKSSKEENHSIQRIALIVKDARK